MITPDQFSSDATAWIAAIAKVIGVAGATFLPIFFYVRNQVKQLRARDDAQQVTIDANKSAVVDLHSAVTDSAAFNRSPDNGLPKPLPPYPAPLPPALAPAPTQPTPFDGQKVKP